MIDWHGRGRSVSCRCIRNGRVRRVQDRPTDFWWSGVRGVRDRPTDSLLVVRDLTRRLGKTAESSPTLAGLCRSTAAFTAVSHGILAGALLAPRRLRHVARAALRDPLPSRGRRLGQTSSVSVPVASSR